MMSCSVYELGGVGWWSVTTAWEPAGHWSAGGEQLHRASLALYSIITLLLLLLLLRLLLLLLLFYLMSIIKLFLTQPTRFLTLTLLVLPPTHRGAVSKRLCGA